MQRRFPPSWSVDELEACFVVRDRNGQGCVWNFFHLAVTSAAAFTASSTKMI
jgi:hypothetical protein